MKGQDGDGGVQTHDEQLSQVGRKKHESMDAD